MEPKNTHKSRAKKKLKEQQDIKVYDWKQIELDIVNPDVYEKGDLSE